MHRRAVIAWILLWALGSGCKEGKDSDSAISPPPDTDNPALATHGIITFGDLETWTRVGSGPVHRDPIPGYEVASDAHVFYDATGQLWMVYTGDHDDHASIKLAIGSDHDDWTVSGTLLPGGHTPSVAGKDAGKETAFYHHVASTDTHQIYYIAYADGDTTSGYEAEIYMAEADALTGPYAMSSTPIVAKGMHAGHDVYLMTSPSVVEHEEKLHLAFLGWDAPPDLVTAVWVLGTVSTDQGQTWGAVQEIDAPIGMEGQITKGPDGLFYAARTADHGGNEAIFLARGEHPFGPYNDAFSGPVLEKAGAPWEVHEATAAQLTFDPITKHAYLYYTGADYASGWWIMLAETAYTHAP